MIIRKPGVQFCVAAVVFLSFAVFQSGEIQNIFVLLYLFDYKLLEVVNQVYNMRHDQVVR